MSPELDDVPLSDSERAFARELRTLRAGRKWSQTDLANELQALGLEGMNQSAVSRIENGSRPVRLGEAEVIARLFDRPLDYFTHPEPEEPLIADAEAFLRSANVAMSRWQTDTDALIELQREAQGLAESIDPLLRRRTLSERVHERAVAAARALHKLASLPLTSYVVAARPDEDGQRHATRRRREQQADGSTGGWMVLYPGEGEVHSGEHPEAPER